MFLIVKTVIVLHNATITLSSQFYAPVIMIWLVSKDQLQFQIV